MDIPHLIYLFSSWWTTVVSTFWLFWIMLLWTVTYKFLCGNMFPVLFYLVVELLGHMVILCLTFWGIARCFPKSLVHFIILPAGASSPKLLFSLSFWLEPSQCEVVSACGFDLHFSDSKWHWASFMCLLAICVSSWEKYVTQILQLFFNCIIYCFIIELWVLYIFKIQVHPLSHVWFANICFQPVGCLSFSWWPIEGQKFLILTRSSLSNFSVVACVLALSPFSNPRSQRFIPRLSSQRFIVSAFIFFKLSSH